jgi:hypothetical protein
MKQPNINGVTLRQITGMMNRLEKVIAWYNKKYNFQVPATEKQYHSAINVWDQLKVKRDILKAA